MESTIGEETHRLRNFYRFWRSALGLCRTVEDFWQLYLSLPVIGSNNTSHYYLFKVNYKKLSLAIE